MWNGPRSPCAAKPLEKNKTKTKCSRDFCADITAKRQDPRASRAAIAAGRKQNSKHGPRAFCADMMPQCPAPNGLFLRGQARDKWNGCATRRQRQRPVSDAYATYRQPAKTALPGRPASARPGKEEAKQQTCPASAPP